jgi:hypothetical protein
MLCGGRQRIETGIELMPNRPYPASQQCALPGCDEAIEQPEGGGPRRLYCTHDHRRAARRLRIIAGSEAEPVSDQTAISRTSSVAPVQPIPPRRWQVPPQERKSDIAPTWIADPFSLSQNQRRQTSAE